MRPLGPCTLLICSVVFPANAHAQCTRSCGQTPPDTPITLYSFAGPPDGAAPLGVLVRDASGNFYGSTSQGGVPGGACGSNGCGVIFKVKPNGAEAVLYSFLGGTDGATPSAGLVLDGSGNLYGTTSKGELLTTVLYSRSIPQDTKLYFTVSLEARMVLPRGEIWCATSWGIYTAPHPPEDQPEEPPAAALRLSWTPTASKPCCTISVARLAMESLLSQA
jgi:uncharacterized repeat protein (TIGR03803 family)